MLLPSPSRRCSNSLAAPRSPPAPRVDLRTNRARKSPLHALPPSPSTARRTPTSSPAPPPQVQARLQPEQRAVPPPPPGPAPVPPASHQSTPKTNEQARPPAIARRRARALPYWRKASPLPPFGSPAVLPPQSLHKKRACRNDRRSAHALAPQQLVPVAHSTQAPQIPSLIDLRVAAPPSLVRVDTPPSLHARAVPLLVLEPASDQQHLAPLRKKASVAVRIVDGNAQSQCSATA